MSPVSLGVVRFTQVDESTCVVDGTIDGLAPGKHALAIHECGDLSQGCKSVGGHFNPRNTRHGSPLNDENERHVGDLGNISADESGRAVFKFSDKLVKVWDIIGRSVVVAEGQDDFGQGHSPLSQVTLILLQTCLHTVLRRDPVYFEFLPMLPRDQFLNLIEID